MAARVDIRHEKARQDDPASFFVAITNLSSNHWRVPCQLTALGNFRT